MSFDTTTPNAQRLLDDFAVFSTCDVADALRKLGLTGFMPSLSRQSPLPSNEQSQLTKRMVGFAHTVRMMPVGGAALTKAKGHQVDSAARNTVICISYPPKPELTSAVFGGLNAFRAKTLGCVGTITDGRVRDLDEIIPMDYPVFSKGRSVHGNQGQTSAIEIGGVVLLDGITIRANDIIHGDINGALCVPLDRAGEVLAKVRELKAIDDQCMEGLKQGMSLRQAFDTYRKKKTPQA